VTGFCNTENSVSVAEPYSKRDPYLCKLKSKAIKILDMGTIQPRVRFPYKEAVCAFIHSSVLMKAPMCWHIVKCWVSGSEQNNTPAPSYLLSIQG
jgi:hypothetical protein